MKTGEGKTLVATLPVYLNALDGKGVHVVTVNDYLAKRDAEWMGQIYKFLGLSVGVIVHGLTDEERRVNYAADVTYGTNNEFGFDYLRDNMKYSLEQMTQRGHHYAIVDEVDSILVDEARTPLIISGPTEDQSELYKKVDALIPSLRAPSKTLAADGKTEIEDKGDFELDEKQRSVSLTEEGNEHMVELLRGVGALEEGRPLRHQQHHHRPPRQSGAAGAQAVPVRQGLHRQGRQGRHHRRVHRPDDGGTALFGRAASGARSQGARADPIGERDARLDHLPELFPALRKAGGHDRHRHDGSGRVHGHLQPRRGRGSDQHADRARRFRRRGLPHRRRKTPRHRHADRRMPEEGPARAGGHGLHREIRRPRCQAQGPQIYPRNRPGADRQGQEARRYAGGQGASRDRRISRLDLLQVQSHSAQRAERALSRGRSLYRGAGRPFERGHHRHQHGGPRHRHPARRQSRHAHQAGARGDHRCSRARAPHRRNPRRSRGRQAKGHRGRRAVHPGHRTS